MTQYDREATMTGLTRALPYIRLFRGRVFVIKMGGTLCTEAEALRPVVEQLRVFQAVGIRIIVVHGGGPQTTALSCRLGIETRFLGGRRITTPEILEAAVMTLNGSVNTLILAECRAAQLSAIGISCVDGGLVTASVRSPVHVADGQDGPQTIDFGEVGDIVSVDGSVLNRLMDAGFVPVVSPISATERGRLLNVNADTVAAAIARALDAEKLIFLTEAPGILEDRNDPSSMVSCIDLEGLAAMEGRGALDGGMLPKVNAARAAIAGGVRRVHMIGFRQKVGLLMEVFTNEGSGTLIVRDRAALPAAEQGATPVWSHGDR